MSSTTLAVFLEDLNLTQYQDGFVRAGIATDNEDDLQQLIQFNDDELSEFLNAVNMLPFHSSKFKKSLRELRVKTTRSTGDGNKKSLEPAEPAPMLPSLEQILSSPTSNPSWLGDTCTRRPSREVIVSHATIYGKRSSRPLTGYEKAINEAAVHLALQDPSLVVNKGDLFERAKRKLLMDGYQYKRGKSRSKLTKEVTISSCARSTRSSTASSQHWTRLKRKMHAQRVSEARQQKIHTLQSQLDDILAKRQPPLDHEEHVALQTERETLAKEIAKLKAQERKHQWYERRKAERCGENQYGGSSPSSSSSSSAASSSEENEDMNEESDAADLFFEHAHPQPSSLTPDPTIFRSRDIPLFPSPPSMHQDKAFAPTSSIRQYCIDTCN
ncbi:hypothetical protein O0I10_003752 [Lichtheimia ornata]|uniref:NAB co-repressor domain-containing protein n=1 Tax=Lichtheimia ornata TaxID=688661 RepID=A0AAD7V7H9_9FUNG|nr:uncharacterized protein O0I10_003752 [Lichtheimia ornata]KAJ8660295.1 hypothetical protein O0I10_003752 [Lichtheimia ornata]